MAQRLLIAKFRGLQLRPSIPDPLLFPAARVLTIATSDSTYSIKGDGMKKAFTLAMTMLLGASLALAQDTGGDKNKLNPQPLPPGKSAPKPEATTQGKKVKKSKKDKKGSSAATSTTPPSK
jgi:hypothetical protein